MTDIVAVAITTVAFVIFIWFYSHIKNDGDEKYA